MVCVQNFYNTANRRDNALIDSLAEQRIGYVPFFPLGGFTPLQSETLSNDAARLNARPMSIALATVFAASFVIRHSSFVIHGTFCSFPEHHPWNTCERSNGREHMRQCRQRSSLTFLTT